MGLSPWHFPGHPTSVVFNGKPLEGHQRDIQSASRISDQNTSQQAGQLLLGESLPFPRRWSSFLLGGSQACGKPHKGRHMRELHKEKLWCWMCPRWAQFTQDRYCGGGGEGSSPCLCSVQGSFVCLREGTTCPGSRSSRLKAGRWTLTTLRKVLVCCWLRAEAAGVGAAC